MSWEICKITNAGSEILTEAISGKRVLITAAKGGAGTSTEEELKAATQVKDERQTLKLKEIVDTETEKGPGKLVSVQVTNEDVVEKYYLHQIGIYGKVEDGEEVAVVILQDEHGVEVPTASENPHFIYELSAVVTISNEAQISLESTSVAVATVEELNAKMESHNADKNAHPNLPIPSMPAITKTIVVPRDGWEMDTGTDQLAELGEDAFPLHVDVTVEEAVAGYFPVISMHKDALDTAAAAGVCSTVQVMEGKIRLWAKEMPETDMNATLHLAAGRKEDVTDGYGIVNAAGVTKENVPGGFVTLDDQGKIPVSLLPGMGFIEMIDGDIPAEQRMENTIYASRKWDVSVPAESE